MRPGQELLERDDVIAAVNRLVSETSAGGAGIVYVLGEAGLGKTSVLELACGMAQSAGMAVGIGRGHPMETSLPFGLLAQVFDGIGARGLLSEDEPAPVTPGDRAARFYSVQRWLEERASQRLLLAFDDLHWADADSLALIAFLCRRAEALGLRVIASTRPWPPEAKEAVAGLVHDGSGSIVGLSPLSEHASGELLQSRVGRPVPQPLLRRAHALCSGNPLLVRQLAVAIGNGEDLPSEGTGHAAFEQGVLLARFAGLPAEGMRCAQAASVLGSSFLPEIAAQVAGLDDAQAQRAIEALARSGLIDQRPGAEADFVHPLFRQALYDDLAGPVRTQLHARAFAVLEARAMDSQAAEHAVLARMTGDPLAVAVLERAARAARGAGALAVAVTRFDAAVAMAGVRATVGLLLAQAEALLAGGHVDRAVAAFRTLLGRDDLAQANRVEALWMLGRALVMAGYHELAANTFASAADLAEHADPAAATEILLDAAFSCWLTAGPVLAVPFASRARALAASVGGDLATRANADWAQVAMMAGDATAMAVAEAGAPWRMPGHPGEAGGPGAIMRGGWGEINSFAYCACLAERYDDADRAFTVARAAHELAGMPEVVATLAVGHSYALCRMGRLREAREVAGIAVSLVELVPVMESFASVAMAFIELHTGNLEESERWCQRVDDVAVPREEWLALLYLWDVRGHRALRAGDPARACELYGWLEATVAAMGIGEPCLPPFAKHALDAYIATGRVDDAERLIGWLDRAAQTLPCRFPRIAAATGRAQLAERAGDLDAAEAHYQAALTLHGEVDVPLDHAETLLGYGGFLRRTGQRQRARQVLAQAAQVAEAFGADWLAGLAAAELRVAGGRQRAQAATALTAQEQRVAGLAAAGASNAEIGRRLYISVSTVETHLEHIYAKLGIHSRYELIARFTDEKLSDEH